MPNKRMRAMAFAAVVTAGCGIDALPAELAMPAGSREWLISVQNCSSMPAELSVAEDTVPVGESVGTVEPSSVPSKTTRDVVFTVPPGEGWAIFVNPNAERGPLILATDVPPDAAGRLPVSIHIGPNGELAVSVEPGPGWFGN